MWLPLLYLPRCLQGVSNVFTAYNAVYDKQGIIVTSQAMGEYVMREFILIANFLRESFLREYFLGEYFMKEHFIEPITI